jgi:hypothetical protein
MRERMAPITEEGSNHPYILTMRMRVSTLWIDENCVDLENEWRGEDGEERLRGTVFCSRVQ